MYQEKKLNAYFDNLEYEIKKQLQGARKSIDICVAWISLNNFEDLFQRLINKGINIRLICNKDFNPKKNNFSKNTCLREIYKIRPYGGGLMHNKFCIIDDEILIIGSYNWSTNAHRHFENIFVIENDFHSILKYKNEFEDLIIASFPTSWGKCKCNSTTINFLINANDIEGREYFYKSSVWSICLANNHCILLHNELIEEHGWHEEEYEPIDDKERMLLEFKANRKIINNRMKKNNRFDIHAQAYIDIKNEYEIIEYGESEEYFLKVYWKHIFFRNKISSEYYDCNDFSKIIDWAMGR